MPGSIGKKTRSLNVLLLVIDSLRAQSLVCAELQIPFFRRLCGETINFRRAHATECWTLPAHMSMFTGLLPSEHRAHFQTMQYVEPAPTIAELHSREGFHTEVVTRNSIFDGTIPGITRGFLLNSQLLSERSGLDPLLMILALSKPRFRRQIHATGFFHPLQRANREFVMRFARATLPADRLALAHVLDRIAELRRRGRRFFIFCNLYDVHAPYPPAEGSILRPFRSLKGLAENCMLPFVLPCLGRHRYLRPGFQLSEVSRRMLLGRYHRAIELMDRKLEEFYAAARDAGYLDDTLLIITSDHGEAFGDHDLYLHDASVYQTHLHVPLWVRHPDRAPEVVDDAISTRDLFGLMRAAGLGDGLEATILDQGYREAHPIAVAEHFHYPHYPDMDAKYRRDLVAAIAGETKVVLRSDPLVRYDLAHDPAELAPVPTRIDEFTRELTTRGLPERAISAAVEHLLGWQAIAAS
jgi:hypothetical protein